MPKSAVQFEQRMAKVSGKASQDPLDYIEPLNINGLQGRMLRMPAPKQYPREILFIYGHHASLERWWGLVQVLNRYGAVTMPDLPGFGGMDSFYKIGERPSIDAMADYLAAFIKLRYRRKRIIIAGMSFGFVVATRMLQRYPELTKKVDMMVSLVGFAHKDDFTFTKRRYSFYLHTSKFFSGWLTSKLFRYIGLNSIVLRAVYSRTHNAKHKFKNVGSKEEYDKIMDFEVLLWQSNDVRTYMYTSVQFLTVDNCQVQIDLPVWHVAAKVDNYFDTHVIEQHMRVIFTDFYLMETDLATHAPSIIADAKTAAPLIPVRLRKLLSKKPGNS
jgi:pimeloyl-ACP methyl ester carboxylesterase